MPNAPHHATTRRETPYQAKGRTDAGLASRRCTGEDHRTESPLDDKANGEIEMTDMIDYLEGMKLCRGLGTEGKEGCWMALAASIMGQNQWTDNADCVDEPIRRLCITINDALSDKARNQILLHSHGLSPTLPRVFDPMNTAGDPAASQRRRYILIDAAVRIWAPLALEATGDSDLITHATTLRGLPEIVDEDTRRAAAKANVATNAAYAADAADAAYAAARVAANAAYYAANAAANAANAADARDQFITDHVLPVLDRMILSGPHTKIEPKVSVCQVRQRMGVAAGV